MKFTLAAFFLVAVCYQASAFSLYTRAGKDETKCPAEMQFFEAVIECAKKIDTAETQDDLCSEFVTGGCEQLTSVYTNNCGSGYSKDGKEVYEQLEPTMRQVKQLCF